MTRSTFQPLRSRRFVPVQSHPTAAPAAAGAATESDSRRTVAAIGLIWVAAAASFASPTAPSRRRATGVAA